MIQFVLPYPVSANRYWRQFVLGSGKSARMMQAPTAEAKAYKQEVGWLAVQAGVRRPYEGRVAIEIDLYPARPQDYAKRMREHGDAWDDTVRCIDLDNANKVLLDALTGVVIADDKWVRRLTSQRMEPDGGAARVVLRLSPIEARPLQQRIDALQAMDTPQLNLLAVA